MKLQTLKKLYFLVTLSVAAVGCWDPSTVEFTGHDTDTVDTSDSDTSIDSSTNTDTDTGSLVTITEITADSNCVEKGNPIKFSATVDGDASSFQWNFGDGTESDKKSPEHTYENAGTYSVTLTVTGTDGEDTKTEDNILRVIVPGWSRVIHQTNFSTIDVLDQNIKDYLFVADNDKIKIWQNYNSSWASIDTSALDIRYISNLSSFNGKKALFAFNDSDNNVNVAYFDDDATNKISDGDPAGALTGLDIYGLKMADESVAYAALKDSSAASTDIWRYNNDNADATKWTKLTSSIALPAYISNFNYNEYDYSYYILDGQDIYKAYSPSTTSTSINFKKYTLNNSYTKMVFANSYDVWLSGNTGGLTKATWNSASQTYTEKSFTPDVAIWDSSYYIRDMSSSQDGSEIYLYAVKNSTPDKGHIIKVTDLDAALPKFTVINTDELSLNQSGIITAFDSSNLYYGASYGYVAKFDGDKWNLISNDITSGYPIEPYITSDNSIYTASRNAINDKLHVYKQEAWDNYDLPDDLIPSAIYPVTEDNIWVFGANGTTYHYDLSKWTSVDIGTSIEGAVTNVYGTADDDIWAVGYDKISNYEQSLILHYDGKKWTRKKDMEKITGGAITAIDGTAFDNVYIATKFGTLFHFDGNEWSKVVQKLFSDPSSGDDELGVCSATPVADLQTWCTGNGSGMSIYLDVAEDGTLFTGKNYGGYSVLTGTAANCPAEQPNRCIFIAADENRSDYPASFNGTTWKPIPLPSYSQYTGSDKKVFHMGLMGVDETALYATVGALNLGDPDNATYEILFWNGSKWEALPEQPGTVGVDFDAPISSLIGSQKGAITAFSINYLVIIPLKGTPTSKMVRSSQIMKYESCSF